MKITRFSSLGSLFVAALLLVACPPAAPAPAPEPEVVEVPGAMELTFWMSSDPALEAAMDEILAAYMEAHPDVRVQRDAFPFGEYYSRLLTAFAGDVPPDVFWIDVRTADFASRDSLHPVEEFVTRENRQEVLSSAFIEGTWDGTLYSMPLHQIAEALYVNKEMAEAAGIRIPTSVEDAWTWDEFVEIASQLTVREGDRTLVWGFGAQRHLSDWSTLPILHQNGGGPLSPELDTASGYLNGPESVEALRWFQTLFTEHEIISVDPIPEGFPTGQIAIFQAPSTYRAVLDRTYPDFEYIVVPLFRGRECAVTVGGWNVGISPATQDKELAWSLVEWMTSERHAEWVEKSGYLPIREDVMNQPQFDEYPWNIFMESLTTCPINRPAIPHYLFFFDVFEAAVRDIAVGGDVQEILDAAAARLDERLAR